MSYAKTAMLLALLTAIFVAIGGLAGGQTGMFIAFLIALGMNAFSLWQSDKMVLRMHDAEEVDERSAPEYYNMVRELAARAELPMPKVYVLHNPQPNAFATGRNPQNAAVAATTGLLETLSHEEVAGVMAHELAHIKNRDTLIMTIAATIGGAISMLAQWLQFHALFGGNRNNGGAGILATLAAIILAPMAAMLVQMAISRSREYQADRMGALICGNPLWLSSALYKIAGMAQRIENPTAEAAPATAHIFIINPLSGRGIDNFFSTHPNTENRVAELEALAREMGVTSYRGAPASAQRPSAGPWTGGSASSGNRGPWG